MVDKLLQNCCGCGLCASICEVNAITMKKDEYGFSYPVIDTDRCIECNACVGGCIFKNEVYGKEPKVAFLSSHRDLQIQMDSSSGGAFTAICQGITELYSENKIAYYGAAWQQDFSVRHERATSIDNISKFRKSKYLQSDIYDQIAAVNDDLKNGYIVVFSGTPCQIAALNRAARYNRNNLYTIDVVCNGVGSPISFQNYLANKYGNVISVDMRHKDFYHRKIFYKWFEVICNKSKKHIERMNYYLSAYYAGEFSRECCFNCPYAKKERVSDFTIGDVHKTYEQTNHPDYKNGVSVLLLNTDKAMKLTEFIKKRMVVIEIDYKDIYMNSHRLREPGKMPANYPEMLEYVSKAKKNHDKYIASRISVFPMWKQKLGEIIPEFIWRILKR